MITDSFNTFTDNVTVTAATNSASIPLMSFIGNGTPVNITVLVTAPYNAGASMEVEFQESDDNTTFTKVASFRFDNLTGHGVDGSGNKLSFTIPQETKGKYVRLRYIPTAATAGKLWAGVTRDHIAPYEDGLFIDRGVVVR